MRKDVKLGLAVGGVLLAVLVVYVLVVPGNNSNQAGATLENLDGSEAQTGGATGGELAHGEAQTPADPSADTTQDQQTKSDGAAADAGSANGATGTGAGSAGTDGAAGGATAKDSASAGGGWNWDALVNGTQKLPSMGVGTDVSTNGSTLANGGSQLGNTATPNGARAGNLAPANGISTSSGTVGRDSTANSTANGGATANGNGTDSIATGSQQPPAIQGTIADGATQPPTQDTAPAPVSARNDNPAARTHVVKAGDTYSKISLAVYGTSKHYAEIEHANPGVDPTRLKPGTAINVPAIATKQPTATPAVNGAQATIDPQKEYKVQPNDSLYTISLRLYGKADRMEKIYELNKAVIGDDMARVKVGMVLKLPEPPTQSTAAAVAR